MSAPTQPKVTRTQRSDYTTALDYLANDNACGGDCYGGSLGYTIDCLADNDPNGYDWSGALLAWDAARTGADPAFSAAIEGIFARANARTDVDLDFALELELDRAKERGEFTHERDADHATLILFK